MFRKIFATLIILTTCAPTFSSENAPDATHSLTEEFRAQIVRDWERQERTFGREFGSSESLDATIVRATDLLDYLDSEDAISPERRTRLTEALDAAKQFAKTPNADNETSNSVARRSVCETLRWTVRDAALANPLVASKKLIFVKKNRFVCQMLHEFLGYYYEHGGISGGGLFVLENPGFSTETRELGAGRLPRGVYQTPSLSFDGTTLYFSYANLSAVQPDDAPFRTSRDLSELGLWERFHDDYEDREDGKFHLFRMNLADETPTQLTFGPFDDFAPLPLPDESLAFVSTRRGGFARCNSGWEPLQTHTLHQLMKDEQTIRRLSYHETDEWNPALTNDGRIVYTRWDYVDRNAARHHGLWTTNPDGTNASSLFGNYTYEVNAAYQPRAVPNSNKYVFIIGGHHWVVGGALALLDPARLRYDDETAEDDLSPIENLSPEIAWAETPNDLPQSYYYAPFPLSEEVFFVSYSPEPLGGMASPDFPTSTGKLGLYYRDRFGVLELLYEDDNFSALTPIPLETTDAPPIFPTNLPESAFEPRGEFGTKNEISPSATDGPWAQIRRAPSTNENQNGIPDLKSDAISAPDSNASSDALTPFGTFFLSNVYESLVPFAENRRIVELRVFQILPKYPDFPGNYPRLGAAYAENARAFLGTVPIESDGSAYFKAPSRKPLYFQAVDENGRAVQTMRSEVYLQDGENRGCVGCHEQFGKASENPTTQTLALARAASDLTRGPSDAAPFSYPRLIQPILDRACVECHRASVADVDDKTADADAPKIEEPDLTDAIDGEFLRSYSTLRPYLRWYEWGDASLQQVATLPERCGADASPLTTILDDENHRDLPNFSEKDRRTIYLWLDANVPFYGIYDRSEQIKLLNGESVELPRLQ